MSKPAPPPSVNGSAARNGNVALTGALPHASGSFGDADVINLFSGLHTEETIALAVSGGGDSVALMHLLARWQRLSPAPPNQRVVVLTVDHRLRSGSDVEARTVAEQAAAFGWPHVTLPWDGPKPTTGLQEAAREARYRLMLAHLATGPCPAVLLTAHTRTDQAETLLMRLARGSGLAGLAGITARRTLSTHPRIDLCRPLLGLDGTALRSMLTAAGATWIEDPTNANLDQERPRWRAAQPELESLGLTSQALARSARRLRRAEDAIAWALHRFVEGAITESPGLMVDIDRAVFAAGPAELRLRLLAGVLARYGGVHPRARLAEIERLETTLSSPASPDVPTPVSRQTLGGCVIDASKTTITIYREQGRHPLVELTLRPGERVVWDHRFAVTLSAQATAPESVRALDVSEVKLLKYNGFTSMPQHLALTAPQALFAENLAAAGLPHPSYQAVGLPAFDRR